MLPSKSSIKRLVFLTTLLVTSCATKYQEKGWLGDGYSEIITNPDTFIVNFSANSSTSHEKVLQYALLRASELALQRGYSYFVVTHSEDRTSSYEYTETRHKQTTDADLTSKGIKKEKSSKSEVKEEARARLEETGTSSTYTKTIVKPALTLHVKCFLEKPTSGEVYDAAFFWKTNREN